ncbi:MAG: BrnA antitoxin family protein [Moraxellaceae bacterium]|nr:BrnA antitoxin family protein [Moraxellaceae bacterium]
MSETITQQLDINNPPKLNKEQKKRLQALANRADNDIDYSDIPPLTNEFWQNAVQNPFYKPIKKSTTVRIDSDVIAWLKSQGKGYQTRLNAILRQAMLDDLKIN